LGIVGKLKSVVIEEINRKQKQELIAIVEIPIIADFHLLDLDVKVSLLLSLIVANKFGWLHSRK
jgi:hypothetical protein